MTLALEANEAFNEDYEYDRRRYSRSSTKHSVHPLDKAKWAQWMLGDERLDIWRRDTKSSCLVLHLAARQTNDGYRLDIYKLPENRHY